MNKLKVLDLFSGIGGFSLGLERTGGFETVAFCEIDPFCQKVLKKHWPDVPIYNDVRTLDYDGPVDVITGGFPCQNISALGDQSGLSGAKSGLWKDMARTISHSRPKYAIVENVADLLHRGIDEVCRDLAEIGYNAWYDIIPMAKFGAGHLRERLWLLAFNSDSFDVRAFREILGREIANSSEACRRTFETESDVDRAVDGIPRRLDRLRSLGNTVYPKIPELIGHAILQAEAS